MDPKRKASAPAETSRQPRRRRRRSRKETPKQPAHPPTQPSTKKGCQPTADASSTKKETETKRKESPPTPQSLTTLDTKRIDMLRMFDCKAPVKVWTTTQQMRDAVQTILQSGETHVGLDTETRPTFRKGQKPNPAALIQVATRHMVHLFHICCLPTDDCLEPLIPLLTSCKIMKTGVGITKDVQDLQKIQVFQPQNVVDTGTLARNRLQIQNFGLRTLTGHFLNQQMRKSKRVTLSNWEASPLRDDQVAYAAADAWASRQVHVCVQAAVDAMHPQPRKLQ